MVDHIEEPKRTQPRVFISYARSDGEHIASELRILLELRNIPLWQDRLKMEGGRDWWLHIVEALNSVEFMIVVITPAALQSPIVRKEWHYARQRGVCVYPIKVTPNLDLSNALHWMSSVHWYDFEHERTNLENRQVRSFINAQHPLPDQPSPVLIRTLHEHTDDVNGCATSPDGEWIISCSDDKTLRIWDVHSG